MFGDSLRTRRQQAGLGLRTFAGLIDQRASTVSAIESGRRPAWRDPALQDRIAHVLGNSKLNGTSGNPRQAANDLEPLGFDNSGPAQISCWWSSEAAERLQPLDATALAEFLEFDPLLESDFPDQPKPHWPRRTELAIEWEVGKLLGKQSRQLSASPVDVEAMLESRASWRLEIVAGLIPHFSIEACVVEQNGSATLYVDRIVADSRPMASYRQLLAKCAALWLLNVTPTAEWDSAASFSSLRRGDYWPRAERDCQRFALALMLPATPVLGAAEEVYRELVLNEGWVELDQAARTIRNRLAEQFAVPPALVQRRLLGWPCHLYGRVAQALVAEELTLPPTDWLYEAQPARQRTLFELGKR